jgi:hypothetical protein
VTSTRSQADRHEAARLETTAQRNLRGPAPCASLPPGVVPTRVHASSSDPCLPGTFKNAPPHPCYIGGMSYALDAESSGDTRPSISLLAHESVPISCRANALDDISTFPNGSAGVDELLAASRRFPMNAPKSAIYRLYPDVFPQWINAASDSGRGVATPECRPFGE